ncbi:uncharacterized protein KIAA1614-like isoform X2 [Heterodontus francisci]|uniref:uncharacterized protein KIAA1614-like isoform X2 n=1 Tax=Heterodontus francisci TaxID=7792 RepID=UPI00355BBF26
MRAFVSSSQLPLSPRHEQAKRLLERARMKARASPLKADHSILHAERSPLETNAGGTSSSKKGPFSRDGLSSNIHNSGNLSDSSSGESHCGLRKKRSQSPSRVRFEDESTQEAEVRYQLRRKCGIESSVRCNPRGLIPKPGLPAYGLPRKECLLKAGSGDISKPDYNNTQGQGARNWRSGANPITNGKAGKRPYDKANVPHINTAICIDGKCSCCGSYIISDSKASSLDPPSYQFPDISIIPQGKELYMPDRHELPTDTATGEKTNPTVEAPDAGSLSPRVIPCWVLPSQHRIRIEPIKETYIGEITSIDDISMNDVGDITASCQDNTAERTDSRGDQVSAYCNAIVSGSNGWTAGIVELNTKGTDQPGGCVEEDSVTLEPVSTTADCKSKSRRKTIGRRDDCIQKIQCQREEPVHSSQQLRSCADSKRVGSVRVSKHSHITSLSQEQVPEISSVSEQLPAVLSPASTADLSSKQSQESSTFHCPSVPQQKGTRSLGNGQLKEIPSSLHSQNKYRMPNSHPTDPAFPAKFMDKTSSQHPLLKRSVINKSDLTIPSTSQQNDMPLTLKNNPATHLSTCISHYRLVHLDPQRNNGRPSDSQAVLETSSLQPQHSHGGLGQQVPNDHAHALHASGPSARCLLSSANRQPKNTMTNGGSQGSVNYKSEVGRSSQAANQFINPNLGLLPSEHHESIEPTKNRNSLNSPSPDTIPSSEQNTEKQNDQTERQPMTVKTQPQNIINSQEEPAPVVASDSREHWGSAQLPQPEPNAGKPGTAVDRCGQRPSHHQACGSSEGHWVPAAPGSSSGAQQVPSSQQESSSFLKAFFSTIRQSTVSKLGRLRSSSMEQINSRSTDDTSGALRCEETRENLRKTPSLQSLRLVSPLAQLRKAASFQSLHSQKKKKNRSNSYLVGETRETGLGGSEPKPSGRRPMKSLSVEDIGTPNHPRAIGQVTETFTDTSFMLELSKPAHGPFGFLISKSCGGMFIHRMADQNSEKLYAGLLEPGDEILEVNGKRVEGLSFDEVNSLMLQNSTVSIWVRRHNGTTR